MEENKLYKEKSPRVKYSTGKGQGIIDNRPLFHDQSRMIDCIRNSNLIQCKASLMDGTPLTIESPDEQEQMILNDPFNRYYLDKNEFTQHKNEQPVTCGLIKRLALWYRIPDLGERFFVLGEQHDHLSYESIVEESNQTKPVLGEKGMVDINYYQHHEVLPFHDNIGKASSFSMESTLSKTLLALSALIPFSYPTRKTIKPKTKVKDDLIFRHDSEWFCVPFSKGKGGKVKHPLAEDKGEREGGYTGPNAIISVIAECIKRIDVLLEEVKSDNKMAKDKIEEWNKFKGLLCTITPKNPLSESDEVIQLCCRLAEEELATCGLEKGPTYEGELKPQIWKDANAMREAYMYKAILHASINDFLMAGIGNVHALHLKSALEDAGIMVITIDQFMTSNYVRDAFDTDYPTISKYSVTEIKELLQWGESYLSGLPMLEKVYFSPKYENYKKIKDCCTKINDYWGCFGICQNELDFLYGLRMEVSG